MAMDRRGVVEGMTVRSRDGEKLGKVVQCAEDFFLIEKGFFFPKDYLVRYDQISEVREDEIHLMETASSLGEGGSEHLDTGTERREGFGAGAPREWSATERPDAMSASGVREDVRVPLVEEEVTAEKTMKQAGEVRVRKETVTEQRQITVPVTREEVHVERVPASSGAQVGADAFKEGTISVPIREEEVEIRKRPVVREEVRVSKTRHQEERRADTEVRREEARIEGDTELERRDGTGLGEPPKE